MRAISQLPEGVTLAELLQRTIIFGQRKNPDDGGKRLSTKDPPFDAIADLPCRSSPEEI
jgi:hypothetical protein